MLQILKISPPPSGRGVKPHSTKLTYKNRKTLKKNQGSKKALIVILQILKQILQILKERGGSYAFVSIIHAVTVFPIFCLNAALKVL